MVAKVIYFCAANPKLRGLRQPYLFCSRSHHLGRARQEQLISALLSANPGQLKGWGWSHLMPCSSRCMAPGLGRLQQPGLGTEAHLSISLWSLHVVCPARSSWVTQFCQFRAPKVGSERGLEEVASSNGPTLEITWHPFPSFSSSRQSQGFPWILGVKK